MTHRLEEIWIAVSLDEDGAPRITSFMSEAGWIPLIATSRELAESMAGIAQALAKKDGEIIRVVRLSNPEDVWVFDERELT